MISVEFIFDRAPVTSVAEAWRLTETLCESEDLLEPRFPIGDLQIPREQMAAHLEDEGDNYFHIEGERSLVSYKPVCDCWNWAISAPTERAAAVQRVADAFAKWAGGREGVVSGRLVDSEYEYWQSEDGLGAYELEGRTMAGLKLIPDPLFGGQKIDVSQNPARVNPCSGHVEAIGSVMWFSSLFWERVGRTESCLAEIAHGSDQVGGLTKYVFADGVFSAPDDKQQPLRQALFPE